MIARAGAGVLGFASTTASQSGMVTVTDLTNLVIAFTVPSGRRVRASWSAASHGSGANDAMAWAIREGTTILRDWVKPMNAPATADATSSVEGWAIFDNVTAGTHAWKLAASRAVGAGSVWLDASATHPAWLLVEDLGAAG